MERQLANPDPDIDTYPMNSPYSLMSQFTAMDDIVFFQNAVQKHIIKRLRDRPYDLTVYVGRQRFKCHQTLMTSMSDYFRKVLWGSLDVTESKTSLQCMAPEEQMCVITLHEEDVSAEAFLIFIEMLYKDDVDLLETTINADSAVGLLNLALFLQVEILEQFCIKFLETFISTPAAPFQSILSPHVWFLAAFHGIQSLELAITNKAAVDPFLLINILDQENIAAVSGEKLLCFIRAIIIHDVKTMTCLLEAIFHWLIQDVQGRKEMMREMLNNVLFHLVSSYSLNKIREDVQLMMPCLGVLKDYLEEERKSRAAIPQFVLGEKAVVSKSTKLQTPSKMMEKYIIVPHGLSPFVNDKLDSSSEEWFIPFFMPLFVPTNPSECERKQFKPLSEEKLFQIDETKSRLMSNLLEEFRTGRICSIEAFPIGMWHASACVGRNDLYISGGAKSPRAFAVYMPKTSTWESLPDLPLDCERHSMAACNDQVYVIGAPLVCCHHVCCQRDWCQHLTVLVYSIRQRTWNRLATKELSNNFDDSHRTTSNHRSHHGHAANEKRPSPRPVQAVGSYREHTTSEQYSLSEHWSEEPTAKKHAGLMCFAVKESSRQDEYASEKLPFSDEEFGCGRLPFSQEQFTSDKLPFSQERFRSDKLPSRKEQLPNEKRPSLQEQFARQEQLENYELPSRKKQTASEKRSYRQEQLAGDKRPSRKEQFSSDKLPSIQERFPSDTLPSRQEQIASDKLPSRQEQFASEKNPSRQDQFPSEKLPSRKEQFPSDKLPFRQDQFPSDKLPFRQEQFPSDKLPSYQEQFPSDKLPFCQDQFPSDKLPSYQEQCASDKIPSRQEQCASDNIPSREEQCAIDNIPSREEQCASDTPPPHQEPLAIDNIPFRQEQCPSDSTDTPPSRRELILRDHFRLRKLNREQPMTSESEASSSKRHLFQKPICEWPMDVDAYNSDTFPSVSACEVYSSSSCIDHSADFIYNSSVSVIKFQFPDQRSTAKEKGHSKQPRSQKRTHLSHLTSTQNEDTRMSVSTNIVNIYMSGSSIPEFSKITPTCGNASVTSILGLLGNATALLTSASEIASSLAVSKDTSGIASAIASSLAVSKEEDDDNVSEVSICKSEYYTAGTSTAIGSPVLDKSASNAASPSGVTAFCEKATFRRDIFQSVGTVVTDRSPHRQESNQSFTTEASTHISINSQTSTLSSSTIQTTPSPKNPYTKSSTYHVKQASLPASVQEPAEKRRSTYPVTQPISPHVFEERAAQPHKKLSTYPVTQQSPPVFVQENAAPLRSSSRKTASSPTMPPLHVQQAIAKISAENAYQIASPPEKAVSQSSSLQSNTRCANVRNLPPYSLSPPPSYEIAMGSPPLRKKKPQNLDDDPQIASHNSQASSCQKSKSAKLPPHVPSKTSRPSNEASQKTNSQSDFSTKSTTDQSYFSPQKHAPALSSEETTKRSHCSPGDTTKRSHDSPGDTAKRSKCRPEDTTKRSPISPGDSSKRSHRIPEDTAKRSQISPQETTHRVSLSLDETKKRTDHRSPKTATNQFDCNARDTKTHTPHVSPKEPESRSHISPHNDRPLFSPEEITRRSVISPEECPNPTKASSRHSRRRSPHTIRKRTTDGIPTTSGDTFGTQVSPPMRPSGRSEDSTPSMSPTNAEAHARRGARRTNLWPPVLERLDCVHPVQARTVVVGNRYILIFCPPEDVTYEDYTNHNSDFCMRSLVKSIDTFTGEIVKVGEVPFVPVAAPIVEEGSRVVIIAYRGDVTFWLMTLDVEELRKRSEKKGEDEEFQFGDGDAQPPEMKRLIWTEKLTGERVRQQWGYLGAFLDNFVTVAQMIYHPRFMYSDLHPACLQTMFLPVASSDEDDYPVKSHPDKL